MGSITSKSFTAAEGKSMYLIQGLSAVYYYKQMFSYYLAAHVVAWEYMTK